MPQMDIFVYLWHNMSILHIDIAGPYLRGRQKKMAIVKLTCPNCGDISLSPGQILVCICEDTDKSTFQFDCPHCNQLVVRIATQYALDALLTTECQLQAWRLPEELSDPKRSSGLPAITHDNILDFHIALAGMLDSEIIAALQ